MARKKELHPSADAEAHFNRGMICAQNNDFETAAIEFTRAIDLDLTFAHAWGNRGLARSEMNDREEGLGKR